MTDKKTSASVMCADFLQLKETVKILNNAHYDYLHFDIMDGSFSPDFLLGHKLIDDIKTISKIGHEYHLMIRQPEKYIDTLRPNPHDNIIVHYELCDNVSGVLDKIKRKGCRAGLAINAPTDYRLIDDYYHQADVIQIMLHDAGYVGKDLQTHCFEKIKKIKEKIKKTGRNVLIEADGSVNQQTIPHLKELGVNIFVGGSTGLFIPGTVFKKSAEDFKQWVQK